MAKIVDWIAGLAALNRGDYRGFEDRFSSSGQQRLQQQRGTEQSQLTAAQTEAEAIKRFIANNPDKIPQALQALLTQTQVDQAKVQTKGQEIRNRDLETSTGSFQPLGGSDFAQFDFGRQQAKPVMALQNQALERGDQEAGRQQALDQWMQSTLGIPNAMAFEPQLQTMTLAQGGEQARAEAALREKALTQNAELAKQKSLVDLFGSSQMGTIGPDGQVQQNPMLGAAMEALQKTLGLTYQTPKNPNAELAEKVKAFLPGQPAPQPARGPVAKQKQAPKAQRQQQPQTQKDTGFNSLINSTVPVPQNAQEVEPAALEAYKKVVRQVVQTPRTGNKVPIMPNIQLFGGVGPVLYPSLQKGERSLQNLMGSEAFPNISQEDVMNALSMIQYLMQLQGRKPAPTEGGFE